MCNEFTTTNPAVNMLIGLFSLCQNDQRLARVCPGNIIHVKASANSVLEKYVVLSYSRDGKFEEYFDVASEMSVDGSLTLFRVHKSSIIQCKAYLFDEDNSSTFKASVALSKPALFCLNELPDMISSLLMRVVSQKETNVKILYIQAIAMSILTGFVSQYKISDSVVPSDHIDALHGQVCSNWTMFVNMLANYSISLMAPLSRRPPSNIEKNSLSLLQVLMNRPDMSLRTKRLSVPVTTSSETSLKCILTLLSDIDMGRSKALHINPINLGTVISPHFVKTMSPKINSDFSMPNDSSDVSAISKKTAKTSGLNLQARLQCNLGHLLVKISGLPQGKSPEQSVYCHNCNIDELESDVGKYFRCSVCDTNFCSMCVSGINGEIVCGDLK